MGLLTAGSLFTHLVPNQAADRSAAEASHRATGSQQGPCYTPNACSDRDTFTSRIQTLAGVQHKHQGNSRSSQD